MEMPAHDEHVVLAFEERSEAEAYALSMHAGPTILHLTILHLTEDTPFQAAHVNDIA